MLNLLGSCGLGIAAPDKIQNGIVGRNVQAPFIQPFPIYSSLFLLKVFQCFYTDRMVVQTMITVVCWMGIRQIRVLRSE